MSAWTYRVVNPATGAVGPDLGTHTSREVETRVARSFAAWRDDWRERPIAARGTVLRAAATILRERKEALARLMSDEMGKVLPDGRAEIEKCAGTCEHAAEHASAWLAPEPHPSDASRSYVRYDPLGVVLAIMPWNFPFWQLFRFAAPTMAAGNGFVLKHAPNTPGCGEAIEAIFRDACVPEGLCPNVRLDAGQVEALIGDRRIAAVTLTGSTGAGKSVAAIAARTLKRTVLELGGSDPFIVLADADVAEAAATAVKSRLVNGGQSCIAAKRFIVVEAVADTFREAFRAGLEAATPAMGPMARADLREGLHDQVKRTVEAGARCLLGGQIPDGPGWFYPATLLDGVRPGMAAWEEELFGPVAVLRVVPDEAAAIAAANDSIYGLAATLFTRDLERAEQLVPQIEAGCVFVNGMVRSDPRLPFGGVRESGWGKELGPAGMRELTHPRTVWIR